MLQKSGIAWGGEGRGRHLAMETLMEMPVSCIRNTGFDTQLQFLTQLPANEAAMIPQATRRPDEMPEENPLPSSSTKHCSIAKVLCVFERHIELICCHLEGNPP